MSSKVQMDSEEWKRVNEVFAGWLDCESKAQQDFLVNACGKDEGLRKEVDLLIAAYIQSNDFIETPVFDEVAHLMSDEQDLLEIGELIGSYKTLKEIGRGGMGAVYLAERADEQYKKQVAIKLIKRGMDTDEVLRRFRNERQILAGFDHPNIARLLDGGSTQNGLPYFVMEYVEGVPIDQYCDEKSISIKDRLELFCKICNAVSYAHQNLVVHRDIKPGNILVTATGTPKLLDFGIAKILQSQTDELTTATGVLPMTPEYASPEQALGGNVTTLSDVYSLGILLYGLLTGHLPYQVRKISVPEIVRIITETKPPLPSTAINFVDEQAEITPESVSRTREGTLDRLRKRLRGDLDNIVLMAIRKEPYRRYQSVEQFSEDIRRHLEGRPVIARKDTFLYRGTKFIKRNKVASAFAVLALIAIGIAGMIRWNADRQARSFQEFGQEVTRMEAIMRYSYLLPLHDIQPEKKQVLDRLVQLRNHMQDLGNQAYGPGYYSLGRGYMALHRYADARKNLELALNQYDYKTSEVAYAYGLTLALLYQTELETASHIVSREQRDAKMKQIQSEFRSPSLSYIEQGKQSAEYSEYAEAMIAFLDGHYESAIQISKRGSQRIPWVYESNILQGESYRRIGKKFVDQGKYQEARNSFIKADEAFQSVIQIAESDPSGYVGRCMATSDMLALQLQMGGDAESIYLEGKKNCEKALQADSKDLDAYLALASLHNNWAHCIYPRKGTNLILEEAIKTVKEAQSLKFSDARVHQSLGEAYFLLADYFYYSQLDPRQAIELGNQSFQKAIQINPNDADAYYYRGQMYQTLGQYLVDNGLDPRQALDNSHELLKQVVRLDPESFRPHNIMGSILTTKAEYEAEVGLNPSTSLNGALSALEKAHEMNPNSLDINMNLAWAYLTQSEYLTAIGSNPLKSLASASEAYRRATKIRQDYSYAVRGLGHAAWRRGEFLLDSGLDPMSEVSEARTELDRALTMNTEDWVTYAIRGEVEIVAGRLKMSRDKSPELEFRNSLDWLNRAVKAVGSSAIFEIWYSRMRVYRWWAEWNVRTGRRAEKEIQQGFIMISKALEIKPQSAEVIGFRGIFWLLEAHSEKNNSQRKKLIHKAQDDLKEAIKLNSNLTQLFAPYVKDSETQKGKIVLPSPRSQMKQK